MSANSQNISWEDNAVICFIVLFINNVLDDVVGILLNRAFCDLTNYRG